MRSDTAIRSPSCCEIVRCICSAFGPIVFPRTDSDVTLVAGIKDITSNSCLIAYSIERNIINSPQKIDTIKKVRYHTDY